MKTNIGVSMKKLFVVVLLLFGFSVCAYADIMRLLPKTFGDRLNIIDPRIEEAKKRAETDSFYATFFYFLGGDKSFYVGSLYLNNNALTLDYFQPGQEEEGNFEDGSCIMAYAINKDAIELIIKRWELFYGNEESEEKEKDIVYYRVVLTEKNGKINYTCAYTTPDLDLHNYTINTAVVVDKNVYAWSSPSFHSKKIIELQEGAVIKILPTILAENGPEEEPYDFWYKIELNGNKAWVYGYSVQFANAFVLGF